jgi:hypothetical protein
LLRNVGLDGHCGSPRILDVGDHRFGFLGLRPIGDRDCIATARRQTRGRRADSARAAGDQQDAAHRASSGIDHRSP